MIDHRIAIILVVGIMLTALSIFPYSCSEAYDAVIKDKYGAITGYLEHDEGTVYVIDKYGAREGTNIDMDDGRIEDEYGFHEGDIEIED